MVNSDKIIDSVCPHGAIKNKTLNRDICAACTGYECLMKNRNEGIKWSAEEYTVDELIDEVETSRRLFHSGGGITITGGEPTLQFKPLKKLLQRLKEIGIHTAMETNGTSEKLDELFEWIDLLIMDIKHPDSVIHKNKLGPGNERTIRNLKKASLAGKNMWVRIPLIPDYNDSEQDILGFIEILKEINRENVSVEILPYHEYGKIKWQQIGLDYTMQPKKISTTRLTKYKEMFRTNDIKLINT